MSRVKLGFISLPVSREYEPIREAIIDVLRSKGLAPAYVSDERVREYSKSQIREVIDMADIVIADISADHPTLLYELGYANGSRVPVLAMSRLGSENTIPDDLAPAFQLVYDAHNLDEFRKRLELSLKVYLSEEVEVALSE
ncbi:MAG TPA: hypothetical protein VJZ27_06755 [Aggregatilineales bacterium]|nr:hypothetical protein [Aggregatilineales bacterium]